MTCYLCGKQGPLNDGPHPACAKILSRTEIWVKEATDWKNPFFENDSLEIWACTPLTNTKEKIGTLTKKNHKRMAPRFIEKILFTNARKQNKNDAVELIERWIRGV